MTAYVEESHDQQAIRKAYIAIVKNAGTQAVDRKAVVADIAAEMAGQYASADVWFRYVDAVIESIDKGVREGLHEDLQRFVDCVNGDTLLDAEDPMLDTPIRGSERGKRISLRNATTEALLGLVTERTEHAEAASIAANRMARQVTALVAAMSNAEADYLGDLTA